MNSLIRRLFSEYPNLKVRFDKNQNGDVSIIFDNYHAVLILGNDRTWAEIDRFIKNLGNKSAECPICCERFGATALNCTNCNVSVCLKCYVEILRSNNGISKCAFCRYTEGQELPPSALEMAIDDMVRFFEQKKNIL